MLGTGCTRNEARPKQNKDDQSGHIQLFKNHHGDDDHNNGHDDGDDDYNDYNDGHDDGDEQIQR